MKRKLMVLAMLTVLALPLLVWADETVIPPEANWTPTPPARQSVDLVQLTQLLVAKGVITDQDYANLTQPRLSSPPRQGQARAWTWDEIDNNPVLRAGRSGGN
jgi:hypothetical protein